MGHWTSKKCLFVCFFLPRYGFWFCFQRACVFMVLITDLRESALTVFHTVHSFLRSNVKRWSLDWVRKSLTECIMGNVIIRSNPTSFLSISLRVHCVRFNHLNASPLHVPLFLLMMTITHSFNLSHLSNPCVY